MKKRTIITNIFTVVIILSLFSMISAEKLEIQVENNYLPGENINLKILLYDDENNEINGEINFQIIDHFTNLIQEGTINSGEELIFQLPNSAIRGLWEINANYNEIEKKELYPKN